MRIFCYLAWGCSYHRWRLNEIARRSYAFVYCYTDYLLPVKWIDVVLMTNFVVSITFARVIGVEYVAVAMSSRCFFVSTLLGNFDGTFSQDKGVGIFVFVLYRIWIWIGCVALLVRLFSELSIIFINFHSTSMYSTYKLSLIYTNNCMQFSEVITTSMTDNCRPSTHHLSTNSVFFLRRNVIVLTVVRVWKT